MHEKIFLDPRIRDYVFIPLVLLLFGMNMLRVMAMRYMNEPKNKLLEEASVSYKTLFGTIFEKDSNVNRHLPEEPIDINKCLEEGTDTNLREGQAIKRSQRLRKNHEFLTESTMRTRKAYYGNAANGYFNKEVAAANPMNMMANPDMMNNMFKQQIHGIVNMVMFQAIGNIFQGFITAQVPFPLGHKFKQMLQQGLAVVALDPTYVSSMSWAIILIYGLNGVLALILQDQKTIEEMEMMASGAGMMQQNNMQPKNFKNLFKNEKDAYDLLNYKFALDDVGEAFLFKFKGK